MHGLEECTEEVWETREKTLGIFDEFLENGLKLDLSRVNVIDIHRLPQKPGLRRGVKINRTISVKLKSVFDKKLTLSSCINLKSYNKIRRAENQFTGSAGRFKPAFVSDYLPRPYLILKNELLLHFKQARREKKKASWRIVDGEYCLFVDDKKFLLSKSLNSSSCCEASFEED